MEHQRELEFQQDLEQEIDHFKHALILEPNNTNYLIQIIQKLQATKQFKDTKDYLLRLNKLMPNKIEILNCLVEIYESLKDYKQAEVWLLQAIVLAPNSCNLQLKLAKIYLQLENNNLAIESANKILTISEDIDIKAQAYAIISEVYFRQGKFLDAANTLEQVDLLIPNNKKTLLNLAKYYVLIYKFEQAEKILNNLLLEDASMDKECKILLNKIYARKSGKKYNKKAEKLLQELLEKFPSDPEVNYSVAKHYALKQNYKKTRKHLLKAIEHSTDTDKIIRIFKLANMAAERYEYDLAVKLYNQVLEQDPKNAQAYAGLAWMALGKGDGEAVVNCAQIALEFDKTDPNIYTLLGIAYSDEPFDDKKKSCEYFFKALELLPNDQNIMLTLSSMYHSQKDDLTKKIMYNIIKDLLEKYENHKGDEPVYFNSVESRAISSYAHYCMTNACWQDFKRIEKLIEIILQDQLKENNKFNSLGMAPFNAHFAVDTEKYLLKISKAFATFHDVPVKLKYTDHVKKTANEKLKIGYLSPDFNSHVVGFLIGDLFSYHNREKFEIYGYSLRRSYDEVQAKIANSVDHYKELVDFSLQDAAKCIHDDKIDILIDLASYTAYARTNILAYQPAPVQAFFLGQTGTMGADYVQYHINTEVLVPKDQLHLYSEKIVYLPETPIAIERHEIPEQCPARKDYGLPDDKFIFCCFNNTYRVNEDQFKAWLEILHKVPNSCLWILSTTAEYSKNVREYAKKNGIDPNRIVFRKKMILNDDWHHRLADLYLDTLVISGGTTGILSAWAGLPVVTIRGKTPQSSFGAGVMHAAGLPECIVNTRQEYIDLAVELANNPIKLAKFRNKLIDNRKLSPLFNQQRYVKYLEDAYRLMYADHFNNTDNKTIYVSS